MRTTVNVDQDTLPDLQRIAHINYCAAAQNARPGLDVPLLNYNILVRASDLIELEETV